MLKSLLWCGPALAQGLPCLSSRPACLAELTELALDQSSEIEAISEELVFAHERQEYAEARTWMHLMTLDPLRLVQNIFGGGDVQQERLAIAALELETANLIRRLEAVGDEIAGEVVDLVLDYEQMIRKGQLLAAQLETQRQRQAVQETKYRTGQSSTDAMLRVWQRTADLEARCDEHRIDGQHVVKTLEVMTGRGPHEGLIQGVCMDQLLFLTLPSGSAVWLEEDTSAE
ncbi:hypothetical protein Lepto7375DRAFT_0983 [Leptolyngbya sp. PCC 7375]|nr:hypothetical protein Lepto7375DRAFT_0983 [Leptolyngbya sp. PCC 7375]